MLTWRDDERAWEDDDSASDVAEGGGVLGSVGDEGDKDIKLVDEGADGSQVDGAGSDAAATEDNTSSCGCFPLFGSMFRALGDCLDSTSKDKHCGTRSRGYGVRNPPYSDPFYRTPSPTPPRASSRLYPKGIIPPLQGYGSLSSNSGTPQASRAASAPATGQNADNTQVDGPPQPRRSKAAAALYALTASQNANNNQGDGPPARPRDEAERKPVTAKWFNRLVENFRGWDLNFQRPSQLFCESYGLLSKQGLMRICSSRS